MITIRQQPGLYTPAYNPMVYVLDSTNIAQSNFKYLATLYVSGSSESVTFAVDPDPTYSQGKIDIHRALEDYLTSDIGNKTLTGFQKATGSMVAYEMKFGEQYGPASGVTNYPNLSVTGTYYAFNGAYDTYDWLSYSASAISIESTGNLLSDQGLTRVTMANTTRDQNLHYISTASGTVYFAEIKTYNSSDVLLGTYRIENPYQNALTSYDYKRIMFYAGSRALNAATLYSGVQPVITSTVSYYTVNLINWGGISQLNGGLPIRYNRTANCDNRQSITLGWKNYKGGFDYYEFYMINRYKTEVSKKYYERNLGTMANNAWSYTASEGSRIEMDTRVQGRYELQADWVSLDDSDYLVGLIESPEVYMDNGTDLIRVTVKSPTTSELQSVSLGNTELQSLKVVVELSNENWRQRG